MQTLDDIRVALNRGCAVPYLGPGMLALAAQAGPGDPPPGMSAEALVGRLTTRISVPHKIRNNLGAATQFIENFKHRKTVRAFMTEAFGVELRPSTVHYWLASQPSLPLLIHAWYDDLPQRALAARADWGVVQGVSQAEHAGAWVQYFSASGVPVQPDMAETWPSLLYQPIGSVSPAANFLVSDSDFVEVLTEIDIQTPIPPAVQERRAGRSFLFLGCRFASQIERSFARQIMKRSSDRHWAVLPETPTRNEERFLAEQNIERIPLPIAVFMSLLDGLAVASAAIAP